MPPGTGYDVWGRALEDACRKIKRFGPEALVVSLGVDAFKDDPISFFKLESEDFRTCGARIAALKRPRRHGAPTVIRVHIAHDNHLMRDTLAVALSAQLDIKVVEESPEGAAGLEHFDDSRADVLVLWVPWRERLTADVRGFAETYFACFLAVAVFIA